MMLRHGLEHSFTHLPALSCNSLAMGRCLYLP